MTACTASHQRSIRNLKAPTPVASAKSAEPQNRKSIVHLTINGVNQYVDLEGELLIFPKVTNDDASDSAAYQSEIAQPPAGVEQARQVAETRQKLMANQAR
jgi:hypothetical protein